MRQRDHLKKVPYACMIEPVVGLLRTIKGKLPLFVVLLTLGIVVGTFFARSPVLLVSDASFYQLYGSQRFASAIARNSLQLFRRVIPVPVFENAGADIIALVVEQASASPHKTPPYCTLSPSPGQS